MNCIGLVLRNIPSLLGYLGPEVSTLLLQLSAQSVDSVVIDTAHEIVCRYHKHFLFHYYMCNTQ